MNITEFAELMDATWPAAHYHRAGPWVVRHSGGREQRVNATSLDPDHTDHTLSAADLDLAEATQHRHGIPPLFMVRGPETQLDNMLAQRGYRLHDPVTIYGAKVDGPVRPLPPMAAFAHWPPLAICQTLWDEDHPSPQRSAIMARAQGPKTVILARHDDRPAAVCFVACHNQQAMFHALYVSQNHRRKGLGQVMIQACAEWAQQQGAHMLQLVVGSTNQAACRLYETMGMTVQGRYHYRIL